MKIFECKCGSKDVFIEYNGTHCGLYCEDCGKWIKWINKDEERLALRQIDARRRKMSEFTMTEKPFDWNDALSEVAFEDFSMVQKSLPYGTCQTIGMALAKLQLLEKQGAKVEVKTNERM